MEQNEPVKIEKIMYKICCKDPIITDVYVGEIGNLKARRWRHKFDCNNEKSKNYHLYVYQFIRDNGGWDNWSVVPIENFVCENKTDVAIRERHWIETLGATLNKTTPSRTEPERKKEYYIKNKDKLNEYNREYRVNNPEKVKEYRHEYREKNKDKLKEYQIKNKDKINQRNRERYDEKMNELERLRIIKRTNRQLLELQNIELEKLN